jgi:hypothetical protein
MPLMTAHCCDVLSQVTAFLSCGVRGCIGVLISNGYQLFVRLIQGEDLEMSIFGCEHTKNLKNLYRCEIFWQLGKINRLSATADIH